MRRYGSVIRIRPGKTDEYVRLHRAVWPAVLARISACHIRNYTIYLRRLDDGRDWLFSHFEYHGDDFAADMAKMAADEATQRWWRETEPCQEPLDSRSPGEWWANMTEVFHHD
jgi:L-rhamnose mutarotase